MTFIAILARLAAISDRELETLMPWPGLGSPGPERIETRWWLLFRTLELEQAAVARARTTYRGTEAQRILGLAQVAYGDLRGLLAGVAAGQLDRPPREGEWSARETLKHTTSVERSYRANTLHAIRRRPAEPLSLPQDRRPQPDPADIEGDGSAVAGRLGTRRTETDAELGATTDEQMTQPSQWGPGSTGLRIDVRFRLHRFASHLVEHTVQCERALEAAGVAFGDARRTVRRISIARAMHERITPADELALLDGEHEARISTTAPA